MIRTASLSDLNALMALEDEQFQSDKLSRRAMRYMVQNPQARVVLMDGPSGVAAYAIVLEHQRAKAARIYSLAVAGALQGRGLADQLLTYIEATTRKPALKLEVRPDNVRAQKLYARRGFRKVGDRPGFYADGLSANLMMKRLSE